MTDQTNDLGKRLELAKELVGHCEQHAKDPLGVDLAPLALFRGIIEMADAVILLAEANEGKSSFPMVPLLRSMLEYFFSLEYILAKESKNPEDHRTRSRAWLVFCINQMIALKEVVTPSTNRGTDFKQQLVVHCGAVGQQLCRYVERLNANDTIQQLRNRLNEPDLIALQRKYQAMEKTPSYFFTLVNDKLRSIENLALKVERWPLYKILYTWFSPTVHGTAPLEFLPKTTDDAVRFAPRRRENGLDFIGLAENILHLAGVAVAEHYGGGGTTPQA